MSQDARSGEQDGCSNAVICFWAKNCITDNYDQGTVL